MPRKVVKLVSLLVCLCFFFQQTGFAQVAGELNIVGYISSLRNSVVQDKFRPLHLRYLSYNPRENNFKLLLDKGNLKNSKNSEIEDASKILLNYFLIGVTLPNDSFWVNLRPDSPDNIIDDELALTDVGKILLESDLQLKKDTAKFTSPETPEGREYWNKLYAKAEELLGSSSISIPTLTRPWIVPGEIIIRETDTSAYIYKASLEVMLEQDYLKNSAVYNFSDERLKTLNEYSSSLIRELIIPKLAQEINTSKRYAPLRQVYYSLIMAQWFKARFRDKAGRYASLIDTHNLNGLNSLTPCLKETYFKEYQKSFKDGEYSFKEPIQTPLGQSIRSYFSGGTDLMKMVPGDLAHTQPGQGPVVVPLDSRKTLSVLRPGRNTTADEIARKTGLKVDIDASGEATVEPAASPPKRASESVVRQLKEEIATQGRVTFQRYMELCLYQPEGGYYTSGAVKIGTEDADFFTFPEKLRPYFGKAVAKQIIQMWENMGNRDKPATTFDIVEQGAGNGTLCRDILEEIRSTSPALFSILNYKIIDISPALIQRQKDTIGKELMSTDKVKHISWEELKDLQGVFLSNELPDAFPVHRVRFENGRLQEAYVKMSPKGELEEKPFDQEWGEISDPRIAEYLKEVCRLEGIATIEELLSGFNDFAVNLAAADWYKNVAAKLSKGYVLTIDYGFLGTSIENMSVKIGQGKIKQGPSVRTFNAHERRQDDLYGLPGAVDITSDVYFPMLHAVGRDAGLKDEGYLKQNRFLKNLGVPSGLSENQPDHGFFVFVQSRGVEGGPLKGTSGSIDLSSLEKDVLDSLEPGTPVLLRVKETGPMTIQEEVPYEELEQEVAEGVTADDLSTRVPLLQDVIGYLRAEAEKRFGSENKARAYVKMRESLERMDYPARKLIAEALAFAQKRNNGQKDNRPSAGSSENELAKAERIYEQLPDLVEELVYAQDRECWVVRFKDDSSAEMPVNIGLPDAEIIELIRQRPDYDAKSLAERIQNLVRFKYKEYNISANYRNLYEKKNRFLTLEFENGRTIQLNFTPWATNQEIFEMTEAVIKECAQELGRPQAEGRVDAAAPAIPTSAFNALDIGGLRALVSDPARPEDLNKLKEKGGKLSFEEHRKFLRDVGNLVGARGAAVYYPYGGFDPYAPFTVVDGSTDVFAIGAEDFGSIEGLNKFFTNPNNTHAKTGMQYDGYDIQTMIRMFSSIYNGGLAIARIVSFLDGNITGLYYFDIEENGSIRFLTEDEVRDSGYNKNAVIEFNAKGKTKRYWYIQNVIESAKEGEVAEAVKPDPFTRWINNLKFDVLFIKAAPEICDGTINRHEAIRKILNPARQNNARIITDSRHLLDQERDIAGLQHPIWAVDPQERILKSDFGYGKVVYFGPADRLITETTPVADIKGFRSPGPAVDTQAGQAQSPQQQNQELHGLAPTMLLAAAAVPALVLIGLGAWLIWRFALRDKIANFKIIADLTKMAEQVEKENSDFVSSIEMDLSNRPNIAWLVSYKVGKEKEDELIDQPVGPGYIERIGGKLQKMIEQRKQEFEGPSEAGEELPADISEAISKIKEENPEVSEVSFNGKSRWTISFITGAERSYINLTSERVPFERIGALIQYESPKIAEARERQKKWDAEAEKIMNLEKLVYGHPSGKNVISITPVPDKKNAYTIHFRDDRSRKEREEGVERKIEVTVDPEEVKAALEGKIPANEVAAIRAIEDWVKEDEAKKAAGAAAIEDGTAIPGEAARVEILDEQRAHQLADAINTKLGGTDLQSSSLDTVEVAGGKYKVERSASQDGEVRLLRLGPLVFVVLEKPEGAADLAEGLRALKDKLNGLELYRQNAANVFLVTPTYYHRENSISPYALSVIAAMLANAERFNGAVVFDAGAGDGLLARVALRLGAHRTVLIEKDPASLERARLLLAEDDWARVAQKAQRLVILPKDLADPSLKELLEGYQSGGKTSIALVNIGPRYGKANNSALTLVTELPEVSLVINGGHYKAVDEELELERDKDIRAYQKARETATNILWENGFRDITGDSGKMHEIVYITLIATRNAAVGSTDKSGKGGIDFRGLPIVTQPLIQGQSPVLGKQIALAGLPAGQAGRVPVELDREWSEIENMLNGGIIPSLDRIKEYLLSSCASEDCKARIDKALSYVAEILRTEEERCAPTESALTQLLVLLESDKPVKDFQAALVSITVSPKEPELVEN